MLCNKLPQIYQFKTAYFYYLTISMGQQSGQTLAGSSAQDVTRLIRLLPEV